MLERVGVGGGERLLVGVDDDHLAVVLPRPRRDLGGGEALELHRDLAQRLLGERLRRRDQDGRRRRAVLGLAEQVGGDDHRVGRPSATTRISVGPATRSIPTFPNRRRFASTTYALPGPTRKSTGSIVSVRSAARPAPGRRRGRDLVGAREVHGGDRRVGHASLERRRARGDAFDACDLRRDDAHVRRGDHRVAAAGDIGADARDGDVPVAEPDAGKRLDLEVGHRRALGAGERPHLLLAERHVVEHLVGTRSRLAAISSSSSRKDCGSQPSSLRRVAAHGCVSVRRDGGDDLVDDGRDGSVVMPLPVCGIWALEGLHVSLLAVTTYA